MQRLRTFFVAAMAVTAGVVSLAQAQGSSAAPPGRDQPPQPPAAPVTTQPPRPAGPAAGVTPPAGYTIGPDDVLIVVFWQEKDMSAEVMVRPDGKISLPLLNDVQAAGLTPEQLRTNLAESATRFLQETNVTVVVKEIRSLKVFITGMVAKPGPYPLTAPTTVLQLIATAGGLGEYADREHIVILRNEAGRQTSYRFNYKEVSQQKKLAQNMVLQPGDTVLVP